MRRRDSTTSEYFCKYLSIAGSREAVAASRRPWWRRLRRCILWVMQSSHVRMAIIVGATLLALAGCASPGPARTPRLRPAPPADPTGTPCAETAPIELAAAPSDDMTVMLQVGDSIAPGSIILTIPETSAGGKMTRYKRAYRLLPNPAVALRSGYFHALAAGAATVLWCPISDTPAEVPASPVRQVTVVVR